MPALMCGDCGGTFQEFENARYNAQWIVKKDSWRCNRCNKVVEKVRGISGAEFK